MMKRIAALFLCLCMISMGAACEVPVPEAGDEQDESPYLFLDIPYGTELLDIAQMAKEKAGLELVRTEERIMSASDQSIRVNGYDANVEFQLDGEKCLSGVMIRYPFVQGVDRKEIVDKTCAMYADIVLALAEKYGRVQRGNFEVYENGKRVSYRCPFVCEIEDSDFDLLKSASMKSDDVKVVCKWRNVWALFSANIGASGKYLSNVSILYRNDGYDDVELGEDLPVYEGKYQIDISL